MFENSVQYLGVVNFQLGLLNLFPYFALDGGHTLDGFLQFFVGNEDVRMILLIIAMGLMVLLMRIFRPMKRFEAMMAII